MVQRDDPGQGFRLVSNNLAAGKTYNRRESLVVEYRNAEAEGFLLSGTPEHWTFFVTISPLPFNRFSRSGIGLLAQDWRAVSEREK